MFAQNSSYFAQLGRRSVMSLALLTCGFFSYELTAQENGLPAFRVDTDVYVDLKDPPVKQTLTLFREGVFYDFGSDENGIVTVIDPARGRIILLNPILQTRAVVEFDVLQREIDSAIEQAPISMTKISKEQWSDTKDGKLLTLGNDELTYSCTIVETPSPQFAIQYAAFADWSARLNGVYPPSLPPYLRLRLNQVVASNNAIPKRITRSIHKNSVYAITSPIWRLSQDDEAKLQNVGVMLVQFKPVDATTFFKQPASR